MEYTKLDVEKIVANNPSVAEIVVPEGVTEIGEGAFIDASNTLEKVVLPDSVVKIGKQAFAFCKKLTAIDLPAHLTEIAENAFQECGLKSIVCPKGLKKIGRYTFQQCKELTSVELNEGIESIKDAFPYCSALKEIKLPESLANGEFSFSSCAALEKVELPKSLTEIPNSAFSHCSSLKKIEIPAGVKKINSGAFSSTALESVGLPEGLAEIGDRAFFKCKLTAIELPQSLKKIESSAFSGNNIESVAFPSGIEKIGGFDCTPLKSVEIPDGVSEIGRFAFASCKNLESVKLPKELIYKEEKYIGWQNKEETRILGGIRDSAFSGCEKLTSIELPENLDMIQSKLFEGCTALKAVKIPASVTNVYGETFKGCTALEEVEIPATVKGASIEIFLDSGVKKLKWLTTSYILESGLRDMTSLEEAELNGATIAKFAFAGFYGRKSKDCPLKKLTIGKNTEKIEDSAFAYLDKLSEISVDAENKKYAFDSGCLYAKGTKRLIRAVPVGEKDGKPLYQITDKVKAIGANAFPKTVENAVVEFLGKIEKVSDKAVDGFSKSNCGKEFTPDGATGGARTVYDAMNFVKAKKAKIESVKKASADALVLAALSDWQYGYDECDGYCPTRKVYRVKLPFGASFIVNMKPKPTQKDAQTVFDAINSLKPISTDEFVLFEKLRELSEQSEMSLKPPASGNGKYLIEFSGTGNNYNDSRKTFVSSEGVPSDSFIEKDIESFFAGTKLEYQLLLKAEKDSNGNAKMPSVQIAIKKDDKIVVFKFREWEIFARGKDDNGNVRNYLDNRHGLQKIIELVQKNDGDGIATAIESDKDLQRTAKFFVISA
ncbi:MAG: leucine-rich repeat domain-containing protein [Treponema sp.]|nr:leucine-rich repeat domain-containing protein [Treponema sp.]